MFLRKPLGKALLVELYLVMIKCDYLITSVGNPLSVAFSQEFGQLTPKRRLTLGHEGRNLQILRHLSAGVLFWLRTNSILYPVLLVRLPPTTRANCARGQCTTANEHWEWRDRKVTVYGSTSETGVSNGRLVYLTEIDIVLLGSSIWMPLAWAGVRQLGTLTRTLARPKVAVVDARLCGG